MEEAKPGKDEGGLKHTGLITIGNMDGGRHGGLLSPVHHVVMLVNMENMGWRNAVFPKYPPPLSKRMIVTFHDYRSRTCCPREQFMQTVSRIWHQVEVIEVDIKDGVHCDFYFCYCKWPRIAAQAVRNHLLRWQSRRRPDLKTLQASQKSDTFNHVWCVQERDHQQTIRCLNTPSASGTEPDADYVAHRSVRHAEGDARLPHLGNQRPTAG